MNRRYLNYHDIIEYKHVRFYNSTKYLRSSFQILIYTYFEGKDLVRVKPTLFSLGRIVS